MECRAHTNAYAMGIHRRTVQALADECRAYGRIYDGNAGAYVEGKAVPEEGRSCRGKVRRSGRGVEGRDQRRLLRRNWARVRQ